ncbi:MAG: hypothetical protein O7B35_03575, partial [Deltaproteobacteria bacterium]|nr:hypothetical protein [Deltaproteobacteria bacterium]
AATINAKNRFPVADMWIFLNGISDLVQVHGTCRLAERCEKDRYLCYFGFHICSLRLTTNLLFRVVRPYFRIVHFES